MQFSDFGFRVVGVKGLGIRFCGFGSRVSNFGFRAIRV